jgi:hypothetical protein
VSFMWFPEDDNCLKLKQDSTFIDRDGQPITDSNTPMPFQDTGGVKEAGQRHCDLIDPHHVLDSPFGPRHPLVILAFDEAHVLTSDPGDTYWNVLVELRRTLRITVKQPIFSLFLSAENFRHISRQAQQDASQRTHLLCIQSWKLVSTPLRILPRKIQSPYNE